MSGKTTGWAAFLVVCSGAVALADTVELTDGRTIHGQVVPGDSAAEIAIETFGGRLTFPQHMVREIKKDSTGIPAPKTTTDSTSQPAGVKADDPARKAFAAVGEKTKAATEPKDAIALWDEFIKSNPSGAMADLAKKELAVWNDRAAKDLVRFGPNWQPRADVQARTAKAQDFLAKAEAEQDIPKALALYKQAADQHSYLIDIPNAKAKRFKDNEDRKYYGQALGDILAINPTNLMALNNSGIVAALDKNLSQATQNLAKAASSGSSNTVMNNLYQVVYMRLYGEEAGHSIIREGYHDHCRPFACLYQEAQWRAILHTGLATLAAQEYPVLRQVVDKLHQQKKHANEDYWGGAWIADKDYKAVVAVNKFPIKTIRDKTYIIKATEARLNATDETYNARIAVYEEALKLKVPGHPAKLVMIEEGGGDGKSFPIKCGLELDEYPHIWKDDSARSGGPGVLMPN